MSNLSGTLVRYLKFMVSTLGGTVVDTLVLYIFAHLVFKGWLVGEELISPTISFECAVFTNYNLAYFYVWRDRVGKRTRRDFMTRFLPYNISCVAGFLLKMVILLALCHTLHFDVVICNLIALCFSGIFNFVVSNWLVFSFSIMKWFEQKFSRKH